MKIRNVAIVHFNTPELTEACILSLQKHGGEDYNVYLFDNSDERPFTKEMPGVTILDNTKGQIIDLDKEIEKYPERDAKYGCAKGCDFGSDKHMMSVQKLWELIPDGFLLLDSDVLIRRSVDFMFMEDECAAGHIGHCSGPGRIERFLPMILWINVPLCVAGGAKFFNPDKAWALHRGASDKRNFWDTGAGLLHDIRTKKPQCHGKRVDIRHLIFHYGNGSWQRNDLAMQTKWLKEHKECWYTPEKEKPQKPKKYTVLTYIFNNYEFVHEVENVDPEAEYVLVTDDPHLKSRTWKVIYDVSLNKLSPFDKCYQVRFHPFKYAHTDVVIRVDGSMGIKKPLTPIYEDFIAGGYDRCLMVHPQRNVMKKEYDVWVKTRKYPQKQADKCLSFMERMGYDLNYKGLYQGCFEIVRKCDINDSINDIVFDFLRYLGDGNIERLDQTIWSFVINHLFPDLKVMPVSESLITDSEYMTWYLHKSSTPIPTNKKIKPYLFDKPITTKEYGMEK